MPEQTLKGFHKVPLSSLRLDTTPGFRLYLPGEGGDTPVLYRAEGLAFDGLTLARLEETGLAHLLIPEDDDRAYHEYIEANLVEILKDERLPVSEKCEILYDCAQHVVHTILDDPEAEEAITRSEGLVAGIADFMFREARSFTYFLKTTSFDYHVYTHSVNVFVYALMLLKNLGVDDDSYLIRFGTGALLHDIGKCHIAPEVLHCKGELNDSQWEQMRRHPVLGWDVLRKHDVDDIMILNIVRSHHEKHGGGGYPDGLEGDAIPMYVRVVTICDVFDALTTRRSYKDAMDSFTAFQLMRDDMPGQFDPKIFATFVRLMSAKTQLVV